MGLTKYKEKTMKVIQNWTRLEIKLEFLSSEVSKIKLEKGLINLFWIQLMLFWGICVWISLPVYRNPLFVCSHFSSHLCYLVQGKPVPEIYWAKAEGRAECCSHSAVQSWMAGMKFTQEQSYTGTVLRLSLFLSLHCFAREAQVAEAPWAAPTNRKQMSRNTAGSTSTGTSHASAERRIIAAASEGMQPLCSRQRQHIWGHWNSQTMVVELPSLDGSRYLIEE